MREVAYRYWVLRLRCRSPLWLGVDKKERRNAIFFIPFLLGLVLLSCLLKTHFVGLESFRGGLLLASSCLMGWTSVG
jgi:hypothetical protein